MGSRESGTCGSIASFDDNSDERFASSRRRGCRSDQSRGLRAFAYGVPLNVFGFCFSTNSHATQLSTPQLCHRRAGVSHPEDQFTSEPSTPDSKRMRAFASTTLWFYSVIRPTCEKTPNAITLPAP